MKLAIICRHFPLPCHGAWTAIWLSMLMHEHTIARRNFFYHHCRHHCHFGLCWVVSQWCGYLHTQPYHRPTEDVVSFGQHPSAREQHKLQNTTKPPPPHQPTSSLLPLHCRWKKRPPIAPLNNNEWPDKQTQPLKNNCPLRDARLQNGLPSRPWLSFDLQNFPYWGLGSIVRLQDLVQEELRKVPIAALLTLPALPICMVYLLLDVFHRTHHDCIHCPRINFLGTNNPACKFYLSLTVESLLSSDASRPPHPLWPCHSKVACKATLVTQVNQSPSYSFWGWVCLGERGKQPQQPIRLG